MNYLITQLIRASHGYVYETAGIINGFFDDPAQAKACAFKIKTLFHSEVEVCGCKLAVSL